jgi:threonine/homoserine/homoserine lactone efflux protein
VLDDAIGSLLPAAVAVALSPVPIVAIVLVLAGSHARTAGPAFAVGWIAGLTAVSVVVVTIANGAGDPGSAEATGVSWLKLALGLAFWIMAARQWRERPKRGEEPEMPGWMASIEEVSTGRAAVLGVGLSAANPKNLALTMAASATIAKAGLGGSDTAIAIAVFVAIGSVTVVGAVLVSLVAPGPAKHSLAAVREFMTDNNATIMMIIFVILGAKLLGDALPGL